ncbi:MAG: DNA mismatch repair endonuclease MutL [Spirochaetota bacterium]
MKNTTKIKRLPKKVYDRIAAGEVIDRPSSILRELLDNAIDASSNEITVNLLQGGTESIEVIDNGEGMTEEDAKLCCKEFTTSKITKFEDLLNIDTYGFRGEALNSISTISRVQINTKTNDEEMATDILIEGSEEISLSKCSRQKGTSVYVSNIFFNIPARRKSMKSPRSEFLSCKEILFNKAFPNQHIKFLLYNNGEKKIEIEGNNSLLEKIENIHGNRYIEQLIPIDEKMNTQYGELVLNGYVGSFDMHRPNRLHQYIFVNSRPVFSPALSRGLFLSYKDSLPKGRYPVAYLFIDVPKDFIDINVHPAKREIKFIDEKLLVSLLVRTIKNQLNSTTMITDIGEEFGNIHNEFIQDIQKDNKLDINKDKTFEKYYNNDTDKFHSKINEYNNNLNPDDDEELNLSYINKNTGEISKKSISYKDTQQQYQNTYNSNEEKESSDYIIIGNLFNSYILLEKDNEFIILDQHLTHKYLMYEKIKDKYKKDEIETQNLIFPILIENIDEDIDYYIKKKNILNQFGFDFNKFGTNAVAVRKLPSLIEKDSNPNTLKLIFDDILNKKINSYEELIDKLIKLKATNSSIKRGTFQTKESIKSLLKELFKYIENPLSIRHNGRPLAVKMKKNDIESFFKMK